MERLLKSITDEVIIRHYQYNIQTLISKGIIKSYPTRNKRIKNIGPAETRLLELCLHLPYLLKAIDTRMVYSESRSTSDMMDDIYYAALLFNIIWDVGVYQAFHEEYPLEAKEDVVLQGKMIIIQ